MPQATLTRPFWTLNKIYWLLYILPLSAWFAMDGNVMFYLDTDARHPERVWFKLGVYLLIVNLMTILVFREDKKRAERGDWRVSEKTLVYLITLGHCRGTSCGCTLAQDRQMGAAPGSSSGRPVVFTFVVLPTRFRTPTTRWGICLFSLFWWNFHIALGSWRI